MPNSEGNPKQIQLSKQCQEYIDLHIKDDIKVPACFDSKEGYLAWKFYDKSTKHNETKLCKYCTDCTPSFRNKMKEAGRCEHPETIFWLITGKKEDNELHMVGRNKGWVYKSWMSEEQIDKKYRAKVKRIHDFKNDKIHFVDRIFNPLVKEIIGE